MIKVGIYGSEAVKDPVRKQLLRLLLRHPDVDLRAVASPGGNTVPLAELHPVYTGETELTLERVLDMDKLDVLFVIDEVNLTPEILQHSGTTDLKLIALGDSPELQDGKGEPGWVYGLAEYNRKALVRGAVKAVSPRPEAMLMELALFPLAKNGLLSSDIEITLTSSKSSLDAEAAETKRILREIQPDFDGSINTSIAPPAPYERMDLTATMKLPLAIEELERVYNEAYEDHNFTYVIEGEGPIDEDLRGSNKCLIRLNETDGNLTINASADALTKGVTGNAVHIMNLFFGLYERTGLSI